MPSLGGSRRRHSKQPSLSKKAIPPPPISVASTQSAESTPAASTPRADLPSSNLRAPRRPCLLSTRAERPCSGYKESRAMGLLEKENVNVFSFMQTDDDGESDPSSEGPDESSPQPSSSFSSASSPASSSKSPSPRAANIAQRSPRYSDLEVRAIQDGVNRAWGRASLHSDSGISVRSHSPDQDSPIMKDKLSLDHEIPMIEELGCEQDEMEPQGLLISPRGDDHLDGYSRRHWPSADISHISGPEAYPPPLPQMISPRPVSHDDEMPERLHGRPLSSTMIPFIQPRQTSGHAYPFPSSPRAGMPPAPKSGYDLLASNISATDDAVLKPIYRKFEILNNRMLLYLQDEIAQMEEDLKELDAAIAMEDHDFGRRGPASRRSEAKLPSQLQWHRLDLLGRCFAKVEQYNRALTSYSNLSKSLHPAPATDIATYRDWIADHTPVTAAEAAFLSHSSDLLAIPSTVKPSDQQQQQQQQQQAPPISGSAALNPPTSTAAGSYNTNTTLATNSAFFPYQTTSHTSSVAVSIPNEKLQPSRNDLIILAMAIFSTLALFPFVPSVIARLAVLTLVGLAALGTLEPECLRSWDGVAKWKTGMGLWVGVMGCLSLIVGG